MKVTFRSNSRVLGYEYDHIYEAELTPILHALLKIGRHLTLIDPLELPDDSTTSSTDTEKPRPATKESNRNKNSAGNRGSEETTSVNPTDGN